MHKFENTLNMFVDLLTLANVSVLFIQDKFSGESLYRFGNLVPSLVLTLKFNFAGYYLHGRSLMQHADTGMLQFYAELRKEVEGIVAPRGLTAGVEAGEHASNQVFEIYITEAIR